MLTTHPALYKGFEVHALVFRRKSEGGTKRTEGYDAAVRLCRAGGASDSRVFKLDCETTFADFGIAKRTATQYAEDIIDGKVDGFSVTDL